MDSSSDTNDLKYSCGICSAIFKSEFHLKYHRIAHIRNDPYRCGKCGKTFVKLSSLQTHYLEHKSQSPYYCRVCKKNFPSLSILISHKSRFHVTAKQYRPICETCKKYFSSFGTLRKHEKIHLRVAVPENDEMYECSVCFRTFKLLVDLESHVKSHDDEVVFKCDSCNELFTSEEHLKTHNCTFCVQDLTSKLCEDDFQEKLHVCTVCNISFRWYTSLQSHIKAHRREKMLAKQLPRVEKGKRAKIHKCNCCGSSFYRLSSLKTHRGCSLKTKPFNCAYCRLPFECKGLLQCHVQTRHARKKIYVCDVCHKSFMSPKNLQLHSSESHTDYKVHECPICKKSFMRKCYLQNHMRAHVGATSAGQFQCRVCHKSFAHRSNVIVHLRIHTRDKQYKCTYCGKSFNQLNALQVHTRLHTNERPFVCSMCVETFEQKWGLQRHVLIHHTKKSSFDVRSPTDDKTRIQSDFNSHPEESASSNMFVKFDVDDNIIEELVESWKTDIIVCDSD